MSNRYNEASRTFEISQASTARIVFNRKRYVVKRRYEKFRERNQSSFRGNPPAHTTLRVTPGSVLVHLDQSYICVDANGIMGEPFDGR